MALGNVVAMSVSLAGAGALLAASALAFSVLKWAGALYLIGLGWAWNWTKRPGNNVIVKPIRVLKWLYVPILQIQEF